MMLLRLRIGSILQKKKRHWRDVIESGTNYARNDKTQRDVGQDELVFGSGSNATWGWTTSWPWQMGFFLFNLYFLSHY
jgi:hypothetical protein